MMMTKATILVSSRRLLLLLFIVFLHLVASSSKSDSEILLKFKDSLEIPNGGALSNWDHAKPPCNGDRANWEGVLCANGAIWGLKLENMGLKGHIDVNALSELKNLRTISLMNNEFDESLPNLAKLGALKTIYLSNNKFSGKIPDNLFDATLSLKKIHLSQNKFSGPIPVSLTVLPKLMELMLRDNEFEGPIPDFRQDRLKLFNVSNNHLQGQIPSSLSHMNASAFSGNKDLCGAPLEKCAPPSSKLSVGTIIIVGVLVALAFVALIEVIVILSRRKQTAGQQAAPNGQRKATSSDAELDKMEQGSDENSTHSRKAEPSVKLTFLKDDRVVFDLADLLKSSAEVLGSGVFGSCYKASLNASQIMVVKRFRHMNNVGKSEFHEHMRRLGRLSHENLLPVVAFYYRKEEKLMVYDYVENFNLAFHLHGNNDGTTGGDQRLDWPARLKIIKGVSKGLLYLHNELPSLMAPHGHLKSSNVLLDKSYKPVLTDYALIPIVNEEHAQHHMTAYKSPEYKQYQHMVRKTDVWALGVLILEILTRKIPSNEELATWVESQLAGENSGNDVFDKEIVGSKNCEGEMQKLLKIGLNCCKTDLESRWDMQEVVEKIEEVKEKDTDDDFYSSYTSEGDTRSSRGLSDDFVFTNTG